MINLTYQLELKQLLLSLPSHMIMVSGALCMSSLNRNDNYNPTTAVLTFSREVHYFVLHVFFVG